MRQTLLFLLLVHALFLRGNEAESLAQVLLHFKSLEFEKAKQSIGQVANKNLATELITLHDLLYFSGQKDSTYFRITANGHNKLTTALSCVRALNRGYFALYYHKTKSESFAHFYDALKMAKTLKNVALQKAALLGLLEYYRMEIAQNSNDQELYLNDFKALASDKVDAIRATLYELIFMTKTIGELQNAYYDLADKLADFESDITTPENLLPHIYFENGLRLEFENKLDDAKKYFGLTFEQAKDFPFFCELRFFSLIRLSGLAQKKKDFSEALQLVDRARGHINLADTLRGNYYLNLYSSYYLNDVGKFDTAYALLKKAFIAGYQLDYRTNTLEVNRLNVILETQQKELENAALKQNKTWLIVAISILLLLLSTGYFFYKNSISKKKIVEKEKELQSQRIEKLLQDQEIVGLDAMISGQEKERQRLANDLHDHLGSILATLKLHFESLKIKTGTVINEKNLFSKTDDLIDEAYQKVRSMAHSRNAGVKAQEGLLPAIRSLAEKVSILNKLEIRVEDYGMDQRLDNALEITIFRITQELITNVIKHASASEITIYLTHHGDKINIMVEDNGIGFDTSSVKTKDGMGLYSIQKRIENIGGQVSIDTIRSKGTTIILDIPIT